MKLKSFLILALVAFLSGCGTGMTLAEKVKAVQDKAVSLCSYLPTANSVGAILAAADPTAAASTLALGAVANSICVAITQWQMAQATPNSFAMDCPRVNGVCVEGSFINKPKGN